MQEWGEQSEFQQIYSKWPECILASPSLVWTTLHFYSLIGAFTENLFRSQSEFLIYFLVHRTLFHFFLSYVSNQFFFPLISLTIISSPHVSAWLPFSRTHSNTWFPPTTTHKFPVFYSTPSSVPLRLSQQLRQSNSSIHTITALFFACIKTLKKMHAGRSFLGVGREAGRCTMVCL